MKIDKKTAAAILAAIAGLAYGAAQGLDPCECDDAPAEVEAEPEAVEAEEPAPEEPDAEPDE